MEDEDDEQKFEQGFDEQQSSGKGLIGESEQWNRKFTAILMQEGGGEHDGIIALFQKIPNVGEKDIHMIISAMRCVDIARNEINTEKFKKQVKKLQENTFQASNENSIKIALCRYCRYLLLHKDTLYQEE